MSTHHPAHPTPAAAAGGRPQLRVLGLSKQYGTTCALAPTDLDIAPHEFVTLLGPSGCGKSTLLRILAGITPATAGSIELGGRRIEALPPEKRDVAMVFQSYALFPHMSVRANLAFGLRMKGTPAAEQARRIAHAVEICNLAALVDRMPRQLSGGQQQRVALARAIVMQPALLLFDEPLSNLDAKLREGLRDELVKLHRRSGTTSLYVTHDQAEAMAMSDRILVMNAGQVVESGTPIELYRRPRHEFTARFLGQTNLLPVALHNGRAVLPWGELTELAGGVAGAHHATVSLRPEDIQLRLQADGPGRITAVSFGGSQLHYGLQVGALELRATSSGGDAILSVGDQVALRVAGPLQALQGPQARPEGAAP